MPLIPLGQGTLSLSYAYAQISTCFPGQRWSVQALLLIRLIGYAGNGVFGFPFNRHE